MTKTIYPDRKKENNPFWKGGLQFKKYYCKNCEKPIWWETAIKGEGRCRSCSYKERIKDPNHNLVYNQKKEHNPNYKDGCTFKKWFCRECKSEITLHSGKYGTGLCYSCARPKGKKHPQYGKRGERGLGYKNGLTPLYQCIRRCFEFRQWRSDVYTRDNFTCQDCGIKGDRLNAHHIVGLADIIERYEILTVEQALKCEELWNINNGLSLCKQCHINLHNKLRSEKKEAAKALVRIGGLSV